MTQEHEHFWDIIADMPACMLVGGLDEDRETSNWRYSLMNWGHDPLKDD